MKVHHNTTYFVEGTNDELYEWLNRETGIEKDPAVGFNPVPDEAAYLEMIAFYDAKGQPIDIPANLLVVFFDKNLNPLSEATIRL